MTIQELRDNELIIFETLSGSRAYNLHKPTSDFDYRGIFILPQEDLYGFNYIEQVSDEKNDIIFYEIGRFLQLLQTQNPNIIELFNMQDENIIHKHPLFDDIIQHRGNFLSKVCRDSFGGYAVAQIKKARGLNKKIVNPVEKERKSILDFCYVISGYGTMPLRNFLIGNGYNQDRCGLVNLPHGRDLYSLFYDQNTPYFGYRGISNADETSNEVRLSSIPKGESPVATMIYNKDGYTQYCKVYKEYWEWVEKRNEDRYQTTMNHGKNFDSKNMMHCIRLIRMALEIAKQKKVIVRRPDAQELMKIRNGEVDYDTLLEEAETKIKELDVAYENCDLPKNIDREFVNKLLVDFRKKFYAESNGG